MAQPLPDSRTTTQVNKRYPWEVDLRRTQEVYKNFSPDTELGAHEDVKAAIDELRKITASIKRDQESLPGEPKKSKLAELTREIATPLIKKLLESVVSRIIKKIDS